MADQLTNFLAKFRNEWQAGTDARLVIECHAGQAWIHLHQPLGYHPSPPHKHHPRRPGPSRLRRRARRAEAREAASATPTEPPAVTAEVAVQTDVPADTFNAAVKASDNPAAPTDLPPAGQAGLGAGNAQYPHHVPDALCPDGEYQSPAVQAAPPLQPPILPLPHRLDDLLCRDDGYLPAVLGQRDRDRVDRARDRERELEDFTKMLENSFNKH